MHRRKITSTRRKKASIILARAIKRGEAEKPETKHTDRRRKGHVRVKASTNEAEQEAARKRQSAFTKLSPQFLQETKVLSATLPLPRPLPIDASMLSDHTDGQDPSIWSCPERPEWNYEMTKEAVEANETSLFDTWLTKLDLAVDAWQSGDKPAPADKDEIPKPRTTMPRSPSYFERNLDVWRELWRVTEISEIILVLLDSRCPLLHYPPSLASYLKHRKHILVLTKVDIVGAERAEAWVTYFKQHYPSLQVVPVEAYAVKQTTDVHQGHQQYQPSLSDSFRERLVNAIKQAHQEILDTPLRRGKIKETIDWESVKAARGGDVGTIVGSQVADSAHGPQKNPDASTFLTVGLIGQPNVGKSSLLNALFGTSRVKASKTPGLTKHLQTMFWTSEIRLVDCPGLVMPNLVPMELQVLSGILPISRVSAVPACVHFACQHLPLEVIFKLTHPNAKDAAEELEDKRTWRNGVKPERPAKILPWTAMDVLSAYAEQKGWMTAQAGRPDIHRAGNAMLRGLAEGRIAWAFWPIGSQATSIPDPAAGIWITGSEILSDEEEEEDDEESEDEEDSEEESESGSDELDVEPSTAGPGRFGALGAIDSEEEN